MKKLLMIGVLLLSGSVFAIQPIDYTFQTSNPLDSTLNTIETFQRIKQNHINLQNQRLANEQYQQQLAELQDLDIPYRKVTNIYEYCGSIQDTSISIMKSRQLGHSASDVMNRLGDMSNIDFVRKIVSIAYDQRVATTLSDKLEFSKEYGNQVYLTCMNQMSDSASTLFQ